MFESKSKVNISGNQPIFNQGQVVNTGPQNHIYHNGEGRSIAFDLVSKNVATGALHTSSEVSEAPKCHPGTREAIMDTVIAWAAAVSYIFSIQWLYGPAGSGKSAILRTLAAILEKRDLLLASFFFFRAADGRNTADRFIPTIAYQICQVIPDTRRYVEQAVHRNPLIFSQSLESQAQTLIILPLIQAHAEGCIPSACPRVIVIDGLDECQDSSKQCEVLKVLNHMVQKIPFPIAILIASRPEPHIRHAFDIGELNHASSRLALDESFEPDKDIRKYYNDKFHDIHCHHPQRSSLPKTWPSTPIIDLLVEKASGQFVFSSTIIKFVEPHRHDPSQRLDMVLGSIKPGKLKPFEQLDALYSTIFETVDSDDINPLLHLLGVLFVSHEGTFLYDLNFRSISFLQQLTGFTPSKIKHLLFDLGSLFEIKSSKNPDAIDDEEVHVHHKSLQDFLFDRHRSGKFFIDSELVYQNLATQCIDLLFSTTDQAIIEYILKNVKFQLQQTNFSTQELTIFLSAFNSFKIAQVQMSPFDYLSISCNQVTRWLQSLPHPEIAGLQHKLVTAHKNYVQSKVEVYFEHKLTPILILCLEGLGEDSPFNWMTDIHKICFQYFFPVWDSEFILNDTAKPDMQNGLSVLMSMPKVKKNKALRIPSEEPGSTFHSLLIECIGTRLGDCYADLSLHILNWLVLHPRPDSALSTSFSNSYGHDECMHGAATILPLLLSKSASHPDIIHILKYDFTHSTHSDFTAHDEVHGYLLKWDTGSPPEHQQPFQHPQQSKPKSKPPPQQPQSFHQKLRRLFKRN